MLTIQIVPKVFPAVDGVGDHALNLAHQLRQNFDIETHFIVGDPTWSGSKEVDGFKISQITAHTSENLISLLDKIGEIASAIILHYVGCGYARRGCPFWLVRGLERYKAGYPNQKLVTMFHETYGSGPPYYGADPPWISAFWLAPLQKNVASRLTILSNHCFTSRYRFREQLLNLTHEHNIPISVLPVFSNVGEAQTSSSLKDRHPVLVVFGSSRSRARVYEQFPDRIWDACRILEIEKIYDIGPSIGQDLTNLGNVPVICMGEKTAAEIGTILRSARAGILNYHPQFLAKSGVYAAYSAYGIIPIVASANVMKHDEMDGLGVGKHYWAIERINNNMSLELGQAIANNARAWYKNHTLAVQAQLFAKQIQL